MPDRTPLYDLHLELGAKMTEFAGWELPVSYTGILAEHAATRERAGLFDVSHMGRLELRGPRAVEVLQTISTNDISALRIGRAQYGLMCRGDDVLRLEAGLPLYGHEHTEETNPIETGEARFVKLDIGDFYGREALQRIAAAPPVRRLMGLKMSGRRIPRQGAIVLKHDEEIGRVTSGTLSPMLQCPIALAYVRADYADVGTEVHVRIDERTEPQQAEVVEHHFLNH